jgi:hypothetical protein
MRRSIRLPGCLVVALLVAATGCSRGTVNDAGAYCAELQAELAVIDAPIASSAGVTALVTIYQALHDDAPLTIQDDWQQVIDLVNAAAAVDVGDTEAVADLDDQAFSTAAAADRIATHAAQTCGITMPRPGALAAPSSTIEVPPETTTTVAGTATT